MAAYINTYMLRLAELYLIYAEAIMGNSSSTSDATALQYFNAVRARAGLAPDRCGHPVRLGVRATRGTTDRPRVRPAPPDLRELRRALPFRPRRRVPLLPHRPR